MERKAVTADLPRIGIYGGAFDPIHCGHIIVAKAVLEEVALDRVLFVPTVVPPHKNSRTPYMHRLAMLREALREQGESCFTVSTIEEDLPSPSYSINTIRALLQQRKGDYFFVLGVDAFLDIQTWEEYEEIFSLVNVVVSPRKGYSNEQLAQLMGRLGYSCVPGGWRHPVAKEIFLLKTIPPLVSSTDIKATLQSGAAFDTVPLTLLSPGVRSYIRNNRLYNG